VNRVEASNSALTLSGILENAYLEVIPTPSVVDRLDQVTAGSWVGISCSPAKGIDPTLDTIDRLREKHERHPLKIVPHIAARVIQDRGQLREVMARLEAAEIKSIFVPAGDSPRPAGKYHNAIELMRDMAEIGHEFDDIGIAAYPEGHPLLTDAELLQHLKEKQELANYLVTQMCFDPARVMQWLREIREAGVTLDAWLGLPGVAEIPKLIALSYKIGVGQSVRVLKKQKGLVRKLFSGRSYRPDDLLEGLRSGLGDAELAVPGFHLFSFNNVEATEQWRIDTINKFKGTEHDVL